MTRSIWKGPYIKNSMLNGFLLLKKFPNKKKVFEIKCGKSIILPVFVGLFLRIYNGKMFNQIFIKESMVGRKLGEFSMTRKLILKKQKEKINGKKS
jgi:small subunit ribosomal protein S19